MALCIDWRSRSFGAVHMSTTLTDNDSVGVCLGTNHCIKQTDGRTNSALSTKPHLQTSRHTMTRMNHIIPRQCTAHHIIPQHSTTGGRILLQPVRRNPFLEFHEIAGPVVNIVLARRAGLSNHVIYTTPPSQTALPQNTPNHVKYKTTTQHTTSKYTCTTSNTTLTQHHTPSHIEYTTPPQTTQSHAAPHQYTPHTTKHQDTPHDIKTDSRHIFLPSTH